MIHYVRAASAECLKLKRSSALLLAILAPYLVVLLQMLLALNDRFTRGNGAAFHWQWLMNNSLVMWTALLLPLFVALVTVLLSESERRGKMWKHLYALPVPRGAFYAAKLTAAALLLLLALALLSSAIFLAGLLLRHVRPQLGFGAPFPAADWLTAAGAVFVASAAILAIHTWISQRWPSVALAVGVGFGAFVLTGLLRNLEGDLWHYFPWALPGNILQGLPDNLAEPRWLLAALAGGLFCAVLGGWDVTRRDVL